MKLEIDSRIGEHTIGKIKYIGSANQLSLYDVLIDRKGDKEIKILGRSNIADNTGNSTEKIFLNGVIKELQINETTAGALTVEITAISKSVLLDRIPRYRSFQDPTLTYSAIAEEINGNYGTNDGKIVNVGEDMADACVFLMERINFKDTYPADAKEVRNTHINIGTGKELSIKELAYMIKETIGYQGEIIFDSTKPDGTMRKLTDPSKLHQLGWQHTVELQEGIKLMYEHYLL